jgi:D-glycero-alpha-D-manno-heptose-7-phosphate kinase
MIRLAKAPVRVDFAGGWTDVPIFAESAGGAVVNVALAHYVKGRLVAEEAEAPGISVEYHSELPTGSGLGTSAALNVCWLGLIRPEVPEGAARAEIAELAFDLERTLGIIGGRQDQYAAALGGANLLEFGSEVRRRPIQLSAAFQDALERQMVLCYTGKSRLSSGIHWHVWEAYKSGETETVNALVEIRECAYEAEEALQSEDLERLGRIISRNWQAQKRLHQRVQSGEMEKYFRAAEEVGVLGGKACGAGGGGTLMFLVQEGKDEALGSALRQVGGEIIEAKLDFSGLTVETVSPAENQ